MNECAHIKTLEFIHPRELISSRDRYSTTDIPFQRVTHECSWCGKTVRTFKAYMTGDIEEVIGEDS